MSKRIQSIRWILGTLWPPFITPIFMSVSLFVCLLFVCFLDCLFAVFLCCHFEYFCVSHIFHVKMEKGDCYPFCRGASLQLEFNYFLSSFLWWLWPSCSSFHKMQLYSYLSIKSISKEYRLSTRDCDHRKCGNYWLKKNINHQTLEYCIYQVIQKIL